MKPAPLCRYCAKAIAKQTTNHYVRLHGEGGGSTIPGPNDHRVSARLHSKAECQRLTNHRVVSVKYHEDRDWHTDTLKDRYVWSFTTWDDESYVDDFFCNGTCARSFAYLMARAGHCTKSYNEALNAQVEKAP